MPHNKPHAVTKPRHQTDLTASENSLLKSLFDYDSMLKIDTATLENLRKLSESELERCHAVYPRNGFLIENEKENFHLGRFVADFIATTHFLMNLSSNDSLHDAIIQSRADKVMALLNEILANMKTYKKENPKLSEKFQGHLRNVLTLSMKYGFDKVNAEAQYYNKLISHAHESAYHPYVISAWRYTHNHAIITELNLSKEKARILHENLDAHSLPSPLTEIPSNIHPALKQYFDDTYTVSLYPKVITAFINALLYLYYKRPYSALTIPSITFFLIYTLTIVFRLIKESAQEKFYNTAEEYDFTGDKEVNRMIANDRDRSKTNMQHSILSRQTNLIEAYKTHRRNVLTSLYKRDEERTHVQNKDLLAGQTSLLQLNNYKLIFLVTTGLIIVYSSPYLAPDIFTLFRLIGDYMTILSKQRGDRKLAFGIQQRANEFDERQKLIAVVLHRDNPTPKNDASASAAADTKSPLTSTIFAPAYAIPGYEHEQGIAPTRTALQKQKRGRGHNQRPYNSHHTDASAKRPEVGITLPTGANGCVIQGEGKTGSKIYIEFPNEAEQDTGVQEIIGDIRSGTYGFAGAKGQNGFKWQEGSYKLKLFDKSTGKPRWPMKQCGHIIASIDGKAHSIPHYVVTEYGFKK